MQRLRHQLGILAAATVGCVVSGAVGQSRAGSDPPPASQPVFVDPVQPDSRGTRGGVFHFEELVFDLGVDAEWQRRQTNSQARDVTTYRYRQSDESRRFEETLGLRSAGDIGGERLLRYEFDLRGGLSQEAYRESRPGPNLAQDAHGDVLEYDVRATLFPAGKITANGFASQIDDRVPRPFLPSLDRHRERYGAELLYNDRILPMRLEFESEYEELRSYSPELVDDERHDDQRLTYEATWQPTEHHQLHLQYEYDDRRERYSGTTTEFDTVRNYVTLDHVLQFGADHRSRLDTVARFQDETGDLARDLAEFSPRLRLQHTDSLASTIGVQYIQESFEGVDQRVFRGDVGLSHRYKDWLDSSASLYGLNEDVDEGSDGDEWGAILSAGVNRENSAGRFSGSMTYNHASERGGETDVSGVVIAESATFRDPLPVFLARQRVKRGTIVVTDASRRRTFLPGQDYSVIQTSQYTSLVRIRNGRILDGQTVLVSYLYDASTYRDLDRDRVDMRVQQAFANGWTPYYAGTLQCEDSSAAQFAAFTPRDVNRHRVGADYRRKRWSVGAEFEYNDDSIDPFSAGHARAEATFLDGLPHSLNVRGNYSYFSFHGSDDLDAHDVSMVDVGLDYTFLMDTRWDVGATAAYRFEDDSLSGVTHGVDVSTAVRWRIGQFTASIEIEYDLLDLPGSDDGTLAAWIRVRREIPVIGRASR